MQIRLLQAEELENAAGLSHYVFDKCLRSRVEHEATLGYIDAYLTAENLMELTQEEKLFVWGAFDGDILIAVSAMDVKGLITMLYVLPQTFCKGIGTSLINAMKAYAKNNLNLEQVRANATPPSMGYFFEKKGFRRLDEIIDLNAPFMRLAYKFSAVTNVYPKRKVPKWAILCAIFGCITFTVVIGCIFMAFYLF